MNALSDEELQGRIDAAVHAATLPLRESLEEAKRTIRALLQHIHGAKSERGRIVLTAEGQQFIDAAWLGDAQVERPATPADTTTDAAPAGAKRDRRGVAQRHPHLPIEAADAPLPSELAEQVAAGAIAVRRTGRFDDALVVPRLKTFIRRLFELEVVKVATGQPLLQVPLPERIVPGGVLADESIHQLVVAKFLDAIPFHRLLAGWKRDRIDIARQVVNDAFTAWSGVFAPLADTIIDQILHAEVVHADESWTRVQAEKRCDTNGSLWTLVGGGQVGYRFTPDRRHARASELIPADFAGYLVTDAWPGWMKLADIEQAGCNAHARRPFAKEADRARKDDERSPDADLMVALYAEVYRLEKLAREGGPPAELFDRRKRIRNEQTRLVMERIKAEAERIAKVHPFSHPLAEGARYIDKHWDLLIRFLDEPLLPPDNNAAENALRINALIRKNSMFFGSEDGADRAAIALTVLHSCRLAEIEPSSYLAQVTPSLLQHRLGRKQDLISLTPAAVAAVRQATKGA
jgi:transposase